MERTRSISLRAIALTTTLAALASNACDEKTKSTPQPTASAIASAPAKAPASSTTRPLPPLKLKTFKGLGLTFQYPEPYVADTATSNPVVHQVALDHNREPGVLTVRFNPKEPGEEINLDEVAEATRQRIGVKATIEPSKLSVAGKTYEARTVKSNQLGLVDTIDIMTVVKLGDTNYVVLTHVSEDDQKRAQRMFDTVLGSLARAE